MQVKKLKLTKIEKDVLIVLIKKVIKFNFESHCAEMSILVKEEYVILREGHFTKIIVIRSVGDHLLLEIITNDPGSSLDRFIGKFLPDFSDWVVKILETNQESFGFTLERV